MTVPISIPANRLAKGDLLICQCAIKENIPADVGSQGFTINGYFDATNCFTTGIVLSIPAAGSPGYITCLFGLGIGNDGKLYASSFAKDLTGVNTLLHQDVVGNLAYVNNVTGVSNTQSSFAIGADINSGTIAVTGIGSETIDRTLKHTVNFTVQFHEAQAAATVELLFCNIRWYQPGTVN